MTSPPFLSGFPTDDASCCSPVGLELPALERFAYELFCHAAEDDPARPGTTSRLSAAALNPDRLQGKLSDTEPPDPAAAIPLSYRLWLAHLLWLEDVLRTFAWRPAEISSIELSGLQAVGRARARFLRAHQFCAHCDAVNPRFTPIKAAASRPRCRRCHQEL